MSLITVTTDCTNAVHDVLCNGLDSKAFNYWGRISWEHTHQPPIVIEDLHWMDSLKRKFYIQNPDVARLSIAPFCGGCISIFDMEDTEMKVHKLNLEALTRGAQLMASEYPHHFADMVSERDDITTADVLIQLSLFGDLVYG